jgi:hypothetical protein
MTEQVKDALAGGALEAAEQPAPVVPSGGSQTSGSEQPSPDVVPIVEALKAEIAELKKQVSQEALDARVDARFKSGKDKRFAKVDEIYAWVQKSGGNVERIKSDLEISDLREQLASMQGSRGAEGTAPAADSDWSVAQAKTDIILRGAGIPADDPEYKRLVSSYQGRVKPKDWPEVVDSFAKGRKGNPAVAIGETGGSSPHRSDPEQLAAQLYEATRTGAPNSKIEQLARELAEAQKRA